MIPQADSLRRLREFLFPHEAEKDASFRREIRRLSRRSLYVMGVLILFMALLIYPAIVIFTAPELSAAGSIGAGAVVILLGGTFLALARSRVGARYGRHVGLFMMLLLAAAGIWFDLSAASEAGHVEKFVLADMLGVMLMAVVLIPALPLQIFLLGLAVTGVFVVGCWLSPAWVSADQQGMLIVALVILSYALFCPVLAAVNYHRLWSSHRSHAAVLRAQRNLLLTENAALTGRLAAALSHELNSPLGAVKSAVSTLGELPRRYRSASEDQLPALESLEAQLQTASAEAIHRMNDIIHRMQRFTNLDRAEVRQVRIGDLLADIIALIEPESRRQVDLRIEESPTPALVCRPQPLSAVLSSLIQDAIESVPKPGKVCVQTAGISYSVTITIRDNRPPIPLRTLATMFDPSFRVTGGRIAAANWNWFTSRQIIRENGGDLTVTSGKEETITTVTLPAAGGPA